MATVTALATRAAVLTVRRTSVPPVERGPADASPHADNKQGRRRAVRGSADAPIPLRVRGRGARVPGPRRSAPRALPGRSRAQPPVLAPRPAPRARAAPRRLLGRGARRPARLLGALRRR